MQAVYTQINAGVQTSAIMLSNAFGGGVGRGLGGGGGGGVAGGGLQYLSTKETVESWMTMTGTSERPWGLWQHEVQSSSLYQNLLDPNQTTAASPVI